MRCRQIQSPMSTPARRSPEPRCRRICWLPTNESPGSAPTSSSWRSGCPKRSGNRPGASPGSAPPPISMPSINASASSNSTTSTFDNNSTNAMKTSPPPAPPTANSWPDSTHQPGCDDTRQSACTTPVAADSIPPSASELHKLREPRRRTGTEPWRTCRWRPAARSASRAWPLATAGAGGGPAPATWRCRRGYR